MTNQNPAPSAVYPSGDERVQDASPAASVVKVRGETRASIYRQFGLLMHRPEMEAADLIACARANADEMPYASNLADLLRDLAGRLEKLA